MEILLLSSAASAGLLLLAFKLGMRRVLGHEILLDILITGFLLASLAGTMTGVTIALTAGLITSVSLLGLRKLIGSERLEIATNKMGKTKLSWVSHPGLINV